MTNEHTCNNLSNTSSTLGGKNGSLCSIPPIKRLLPIA